MDTANTENLIMFPSDRIKRHHPIPEQKLQDMAIESYVNRLVDIYSEFLLKRLAMNGVDVTVKNFDKYYALTVECLRATTMMAFNLEHPLQEPMQYMIEEIEKSE